MRPWINLEYFYNQIIKILAIIYLLIVLLLTKLQSSEVKIFSLIISFIIIAGIIYTLIKITQLKKTEGEDISELIPTEEALGVRQSRWDTVTKHMESDNQADWRMAILEADNLLDEIIKKIGVPGDNIGERLKNMEVSDFNNLQNAWEAHKIRNRIAHEGVKFQITKEEAGRVISLYKKSLQEFKFI